MNSPEKESPIDNLKKYNRYVPDIDVVQLLRLLNYINSTKNDLVTKLFTEEADVRCLPESLNARFAQIEGKIFRKNMAYAFAEIAFFLKQVNLPRYFEEKPFTVSLSISRLFFSCPEANDYDVVPAYASNIFRIHSEHFSFDEETQAIMHHVLFCGGDESTDCSLVLELPGLPPECITGLPQILFDLEKTGFFGSFEICQINLSVALQSSIQKRLNGSDSKSTCYFTSSKGPSGSNIIVYPDPVNGIMLREFDTPEQASTTPVTSLFVKRRLLF